MAVPVIESSNTATGASVTSLVITKPTGLAEGDLLLAELAMYDILDANRIFSTPAGWTAVTNSTTGSSTRLVRTAVFSKVASSGDAVATNFTFPISGAVGYASGFLARITGHATPAINISESDDDGTSTASPSHTTALTPDTPTNSLVVFNIAGWDADTSTETVASYASTPAATWTEEADIGVESAGDGLIHGVASAPYTSDTEITNRTATFSKTSGNNASSMVVIRGVIDTTGTQALPTASPIFFTADGLVDSSGSNSLFFTSPVFSSNDGFANDLAWIDVSKTEDVTTGYILDIGSGFGMDIGSGFELIINDPSPVSGEWIEVDKST